MTLKAMKAAKVVAPPKRHPSTKAKKVMPAKKAMKVLNAMKSMKAANADTPATPKRRLSSGDGKANRREQISEQISEQIRADIPKAKGMDPNTEPPAGMQSPAAKAKRMKPETATEIIINGPETIRLTTPMSPCAVLRCLLVEDVD